MLRYLTSGESHGKSLISILDGIPANIELNIDEINYELEKRQGGYGRGGRMKIEKDKINILGGVRGKITLGGPISIEIKNKDYENWIQYMNPMDNIDFETKKVENYEEITGKGIKYNIDGKTVLAGNSSLVGKEDEVAESTKIYLKIDDELVGAILLKDEAKHGTKEAIQALNSRGIVTKMFTGDNKKAAKQIAEELGISEFEAEMLPDQKYSELEKELEKYKGTNGKVAFVGDGINDSPVLARADVGISMGGVGSGSAIEASDIVVMTDSIDRIDCAIDISKKTSKIIKQNLIFSIGVKIVVLVLSVFGVANMWEAVFADVGATLITVLNSLRILK
mgnify:CR=1 FL=1